MVICVKFENFPQALDVATAILQKAEKEKMKMPSFSKCKEAVTLLLEDCKTATNEGIIPQRGRDGTTFFGFYDEREGLFIFAADIKATIGELKKAISA